MGFDPLWRYVNAECCMGVRVRPCEAPGVGMDEH